MLVEGDGPFSETLNQLEQAPCLAVDLETTGLVPWSVPSKNEICGIAVFNGKESFYFPLSHTNTKNITPEQLKHLVGVIQTRNTLINHNIKFDLNFLSQIGMKFEGVLIDTINALYLQDETKPKGLKVACDEILGKDSSQASKDLDEELRQWGYKKDEMWRLSGAAVAPYAEQDTRLAWRLHEELWNKLSSKKRDLWIELNALTLISHRMEVHGLPVDIPTMEILEKEAQMNANRLFIECFNIERRLNISSPAAVAKYFGIASADKDHLKKVDNELARKIMEFNKWDKGISTYYRPYRTEFLAKDSRIHASFKITGTRSGRWSSATPNLQNIPRKSKTQRVKEVFQAPEGYSFIEVDYCQAEIRLAAHYTKDESLCAAIHRGEDIHSFVAKEAGIDRQTAKTINFATIYGAGAAVLAEQLNITETKARDFLDKYDKRFPGYKQMARQVNNIATEYGAIQMWNGRERHFNPAIGELPRTAFNQLIQGGVAQMMNRTMVKLNRMLPEATMISQIHDACYFMVPDEKVLDVCREVKAIMEDQPQFRVPMTVDAKVGKNLGNGMEKHDI